MIFHFKAVLLNLALVCSLASFAVAQGVADTQIVELRDQVKKAAQLWKDSKADEAIVLTESATKALTEAIPSATTKQLAELKKVHAQLAEVHGALSIEGAELPALGTWQEIMEGLKNSKLKSANKPKDAPKSNGAGPTNPANSGVSFSRDLAPWMVQQCGRCHVEKAQGGFSLESYEAIAKGSKAGVVVFPGDVASSRLVEVIEIGDMPRGGGKVSPENLAKLKTWIAEGAKFDGESPSTSLKTLAGAKANSPTAAPSAASSKPPSMPAERPRTGKETVSFSNQVAPILVANCNGCHYMGQRNSGGLNFNNFAGLAKGGDSGSPVEPTKAEDSLLIKKLRGTSGQRMPAGGRPALSEEQIKLIATWITEGATFDGSSKESRLDAVIAKSWAEKANHEELTKRRSERARERWAVVAPKSAPDEAQDSDFHVIGNIGSGGAKQLLTQANNAARQVRKQFKLGREPIVKGGVTIFALKQRYDYSEFGKMLEQRELPADWSAHWKNDPLDQYVAIVFDKSDAKMNESALVQQIASLWVASHNGVPHWFADGAGREAMASYIGHNVLRVQPWLKRGPEALAELKTLKPFLDEKMNDEDSAAIGFGIIRMMHESQMKRQFDLILKGLASGESFEKATNRAVGPIDVFLQNALGKPKQ